MEYIMKKLKLLLAAFMVFGLVGCGGDNQSTTPSNSNTSAPKEETNSNSTNLTDLSSLTTIEQLEEYIEKDIENTLSKLTTDQEKLSSEIDTYEKYVNNVSKVEAYYNEALEETNQLGIRLREYSLKYAQIVLDNKNGYDEKYDELDGIYDCIYDDAGKDMYDIYDDILKDMYDIFYDGVVKDGYDVVPYKEWSDVHSNEYDLWSDTRSEVYDIWSDARSDIYDFGSDIKSEVYDRDDERINKIITKFTDDISKLKAEK